MENKISILKSSEKMPLNMRMEKTSFPFWRILTSDRLHQNTTNSSSYWKKMKNSKISVRIRRWPTIYLTLQIGWITSVWERRWLKRRINPKSNMKRSGKTSTPEPMEVFSSNKSSVSPHWGISNATKTTWWIYRQKSTQSSLNSTSESAI